MLLPLTKVAISSELQGALATTDVELTYLNPSLDKNLECTYTFPLEKTSVLTNFEATINGKVIRTQVKEA